MLEAITRKWWLVLVRGICAIAFGLFAFAWPGATLAALILVFGVYATVDGIVGIALGITGGVEGVPRWWQMLIVGIVSLLAGIVTFARPGITAVALLSFIAIWAIFRGVAEIAAAIRLRSLIEDEWLLILGGLCSVIFGGILIARPGAGALAVLWIIGVYAVLFGILLVALSMRMRAFHNRLAHMGGGATPATN